MSKVLTIGTFDTPHVGHAVLINRCKQLGDNVIVGVNSDRFVTEYKGKAPLYDEIHRMALIGQLGVDVRLNDGPGRALVLSVIPDYVVIGNDWLGRDYLKQINMTPKDFQDWDLTLVYVPATMGISTTDLRERLGNESR